MEEHYREDYWKLAEIENGFNQVQGTVRTLASTWTLATFAGLAVLSKAEAVNWLAPPAFLAWLVCMLAVFGLALLWIMDQYVYQRLLEAPFLYGLVMEQKHTDLPAIRSAMFIREGRGMSMLLKSYYFAPMCLFMCLGVAVLVIDATHLLEGGRYINVYLYPVLLAATAGMGYGMWRLYLLSQQVGTTKLAGQLKVSAVDVPQVTQAALRSYQMLTRN